MLDETHQNTNKNIDGLWFLTLLIVGAFLSATLATTVFEMTVFLSGIVCVGLIAIGRREGYVIGLYSSVSYSIIAYGNGLFGEFYLNLFFFLPTGMIGFIMWRKHTLHDKTVAMRYLTWFSRFVVAAICLLCTIGLGVLLGLNKDQNTPFIDAATNVLSVVATFLMMWRYKEQWLLYILINLVSLFMWALRMVAGGESGDLIVLMWSLFLLNSIFGYWRWHVGAKQQKPTIRTETNEETACDVA